MKYRVAVVELLIEDEDGTQVLDNVNTLLTRVLQHDMYPSQALKDARCSFVKEASEKDYEEITKVKFRLCSLQK